MAWAPRSATVTGDASALATVCVGWKSRRTAARQSTGRHDGVDREAPLQLQAQSSYRRPSLRGFSHLRLVGSEHRHLRLVA